MPVDGGPTGARLLHDGLNRLARVLGAHPPLNLWVRTAPSGAEHFCWRIDVLPRLTHLAGLELGAGVPVCEHMTNLAALPADGFAFTAAPRGSRERAGLFSELHGKLAAAAAAKHPDLVRWEERRVETEVREQEERVVFDRELFYAIQPEKRLVEVIDRYRGAV